MKKVIKSILTLAFALCLNGVGASAQSVVIPKCPDNNCENFRIGMYRIKDTLTMNLLMEKAKGKRVTIRLVDPNGKTLYTEFLSKAIRKFSRKFNFSQVEDGHYTLEISDQSERIVKNIFLTSRDVREMPTRMVTMN